MIFDTIKTYGLVIALGAAGVGFATAGVTTMLWRSSAKTVAAQKVTIDAATAATNQAIANLNQANSRYDGLVSTVKGQFESLNTTLASHSRALAAISVKTNKSLTTVRQLRENSDVATRAVLDTPLPEHACLLDPSFCAASPTGGRGGEGDQGPPAQ